MPTLLVIDDDRSVRHVVEQAFAGDGVRVCGEATAESGVDAVKSLRPDVVLLDIILPKASGLDVLQRIKNIDPKLPVVFITVGGSSDSAIDAMMLGAYDYVLKPLDVAKLKERVAAALETRRLMNVPVGIAAGEPADDGAEPLVGRSPKMLEVYKAIARAAPQDITVLIHGESGTGKELVARAIYQHSTRRDGPFLAVNCAAMTETLLESELFGHEKGSFTGADRRRIGKFEQCNGGTIFLDEVGDMSPLVQSKVLRVLQEQKFERVGGNETIATDVRIISATNRDLEAMCGEGKFRSDLYYRLHGFTIDLPPLRERGEDVSLLLEHFLARFRRELGKPEVTGIAVEAASLLVNYPWPGNVRELQSVVRRALLSATGPVIVPEFLPDEIRGIKSRPAPSSNGNRLPKSDLKPLVEGRLREGSTDLYAETLEAMERYLITRVLQETGGNQSRAAEILGITRGKIRDRIAAFGISLGKEVSIDTYEEEAAQPVGS
ncbi:MAG: sigma-54-dependent Fis family transcriptional regulator [Planctomycetia bacterium]|nr:sigma-54-dependent Fis family transcriptional regulator [Planctomycetia bacterium]